MESEDFEVIMQGINNRVSTCAKYLDDILTTEDLANKTINECIELKKFCEDEYIIMSKIVMVDLYHVLGMGNLSSPQLLKFMAQVRKYLQYRGDIQSIRGRLNSLSSLPKLPVHSKFKLLALCDLTLTADGRGCKANSDGGECVEDNASIDDFTQISNITTIFNPEVEGEVLVGNNQKLIWYNNQTREMKFRKSNVHIVIPLLVGKLPTVEAVIENINKGNAFAGVEWFSSSSSKDFYGGIASRTMINRIKNLSVSTTQTSDI